MKPWEKVKQFLQRLFTILETPIRYIFGRDIFISYSRVDAGKYAPNLALALQAKRPKLSFYLDKWIAPPDNKLPRSLKRHLRWSSILVLVCTENAVKSDFVRQEIRSFARLGRKIVPISVDGAFLELAHDDELWRRISGASPEPESLEAIEDGRASETVIERIIESVRFSIQDQRLRRAVWGSVAFIVLSIGGAVLFSVIQVRQANAKVAVATLERMKAEATRDDANVKRAEADEATTLAKKELEGAQTKIKEANTLAKSADDKRIAAELQQHDAEQLRDQARADAQRQGAISEARSIANQSENLLRQRREELPRALSLAMTSVQKANAVGVHAVEADSALRDSLALLPRLRNKRKYAGHEHPPAAIALSPDGRYLAILSHSSDQTPSAIKKLRVYESESKTPIEEQRAVRGVDCECSDIALSNGLDYAAALTEEGFRIISLKGAPLNRKPIQLDKGVAAEKFALSPGGRYLAFYFEEGKDAEELSKVRVLDANNGKLIKAIDDLNMRIEAIAFGPTGNLAIGGEYLNTQGGRPTGRVIIWSLFPKQCRTAEPELMDASFHDPEIIPQQEIVIAVAPGADETYFATDRGMWKRQSGRMDYQQVARFPYDPPSYESSSSIERMAFGVDGRNLTLARGISAIYRNDNDNDEDDLEVWDTAEHRHLTQVFQSKAVSSVDFQRDGKAVAAMIYQPKAGDLPQVFKASGDTPDERLAFELGKGEKAVNDFQPSEGFVVSTDGKMAIVREIAGNRKPMRAALGDRLKSVDVATLSRGGQFLALSGTDDKDKLFILVYRLGRQSYEMWREIPQGEEMTTREMSLSNDGQRLAVLYVNENDETSVRVWNVGNKRDISPKILTEVGVPETAKHLVVRDVAQMKLSPGGRFLALMENDGNNNRARLLDLSKGKKAMLMPLLDASTIKTIAFSSDDRYLGLGSDEGTLYVFDTRSSIGVTEIARLQHTGEVTAIAFSEDDKYVATASSDPHFPDHRGEKESYPMRVWLLQPADLLTEAQDRLTAITNPGSAQEEPGKSPKSRRSH